MKKFEYKLEEILNIKYKLENMAKAEFGTANKIYNQEIDKLNMLYGKKSTYEEALRELFKESFNILDMKNTQNSIESVKYMIVKQKEEVVKRKCELEKAREKLNEAVLERKTHEKLKEKAFNEYLMEMKKEEDKEVDELNSYKYGKKNK